jgi:hypothetical protein
MGEECSLRRSFSWIPERLLALYTFCFASGEEVTSILTIIQHITHVSLSLRVVPKLQFAIATDAPADFQAYFTRRVY